MERTHACSSRSLPSDGTEPGSWIHLERPGPHVRAQAFRDPQGLAHQRHHRAHHHVIQMAIIVTMFLAIGYTGQQGEFLLFMSLLIVVLAPMAVGLGWVTTFILALVACIQARSRMPQVQPDGWIQAKTPTLALLGTSIVTGLPTLIMYVVLHEALSRDYTEDFIDGFLEPLLMFCGLTQVLIVVGFVFLLRMSKALDPAVRASQASGGQPA